jgi:glycosyltransferase involved in cell wall biosynthesis
MFLFKYDACFVLYAGRRDEAPSYESHPVKQLLNDKNANSHLERIKGLKEIILALKLLKNEHDFNLIIAGEGPDKYSFIQECKSQIPGKFEYVGVVYGREKQMVFERSHIFLMPSYYEGLPYSLLEAMAYKLVPIVTPVGSVPELVEDGKNGFVVQVNDYLSLYKRTAELIDNPDMMKRMCSNAFNIIRSKYSLSNHIQEINKIYFELSGLNW